MYLGIVTGTVVATQKAAGLDGQKLLLVQPIDDQRRPTGDVQVACDVAQAGVGDLVYLVGSREAALALDPFFVPVDATIVGIVDDVHAVRPAVGSPAARRVARRLHALDLLAAGERERAGAARAGRPRRGGGAVERDRDGAAEERVARDRAGRALPGAALDAGRGRAGLLADLG